MNWVLGIAILCLIIRDPQFEIRNSPVEIRVPQFEIRDSRGALFGEPFITDCPVLTLKIIDSKAFIQYLFAEPIAFK